MGCKSYHNQQDNKPNWGLHLSNYDKQSLAAADSELKQTSKKSWFRDTCVVGSIGCQEWC
jgi:hypothetical protein